MAVCCRLKAKQVPSSSERLARTFSRHFQPFLTAKNNSPDLGTEISKPVRVSDTSTHVTPCYDLLRPNTRVSVSCYEYRRNIGEGVEASSGHTGTSTAVALNAHTIKSSHRPTQHRDAPDFFLITDSKFFTLARFWTRMCCRSSLPTELAMLSHVERTQLPNLAGGTLHGQDAQQRSRLQRHGNFAVVEVAKLPAWA